MRILVHLGKGGVGKTTLSAATACHLAAAGKRVLVMSTDQAHSLGDALGAALEGAPREVMPGLDAMEIDAGAESARAWGHLRAYLQTLMAQPEGGIEAQEALILPGLEELFCLLKVLECYEAGGYDALIVDCAPTGETLSLLRLPERAALLVERFLPPVRLFTQLAGPQISKKTGVPKPDSAVFDEFEQLVDRLNRLQALLRNRDTTSLRLVTTPERLALEETRRSFTWLHLYDYNVDAVFVNRVYPKEALAGYFAALGEAQRQSMQVIEQSFRGRALFTLPMQGGELIGPKALGAVAAHLYNGINPLEVFCREPVYRLTERDGRTVLSVSLPGVQAGQCGVVRDEDELLLTVSGETRRLHLPAGLGQKEILAAGWQDGMFSIEFT